MTREEVAYFECYIPKSAGEMLVLGRLYSHFRDFQDTVLSFDGKWKLLRGKRVRITIEIVGEGGR